MFHWMVMSKVFFYFYFFWFMQQKMVTFSFVKRLGHYKYVERRRRFKTFIWLIEVYRAVYLLCWWISSLWSLLREGKKIGLFGTVRNDDYNQFFFLLLHFLNLISSHRIGDDDAVLSPWYIKVLFNRNWGVYSDNEI